MTQRQCSGNDEWPHVSVAYHQSAHTAVCDMFAWMDMHITREGGYMVGAMHAHPSRGVCVCVFRGCEHVCAYTSAMCEPSLARRSVADASVASCASCLSCVCACVRACVHASVRCLKYTARTGVDPLSCQCERVHGSVASYNDDTCEFRHMPNQS